MLQPVKIKRAEEIERLRQYEADVYVVAAFGQILSQEILDLPHYGSLCIHASLLPAYRGASPVSYTHLDVYKRQAAEAAEKKAAAIIVSQEVELPKQSETTLIRVEDTRYALAFVSAAWFDHPAKKLTTIGITGTKGKTTTTYLVKSILENAGRKVGPVSYTHLIAEMADYVVVMYAGRVVEKGTVQEIFSNPSHPYTIGCLLYTSRCV